MVRQQLMEASGAGLRVGAGIGAGSGAGAGSRHRHDHSLARTPTTTPTAERGAPCSHKVAFPDPTSLTLIACIPLPLHPSLPSHRPDSLVHAEFSVTSL